MSSPKETDLDGVNKSGATSNGEKDQESAYAPPLSWRESAGDDKPESLSPRRFAPAMQTSFPGRFGEEPDDSALKSLDSSRRVVATKAHDVSEAPNEQDHMKELAPDDEQAAVGMGSKDGGPEIVPDSSFKPPTFESLWNDWDQKKKINNEARALGPGAVAVDADRVMAPLPVKGADTTENFTKAFPFDESFGMIPNGSQGKRARTRAFEKKTGKKEGSETEESESADLIPLQRNPALERTSAQTSPGAQYIAGIGGDMINDWESSTSMVQSRTTVVAPDLAREPSTELISATMVEEPFITEAKAISEETLRRRRRKIIGCGVVMMIAIIITVVLSVVLTRNNSPAPATDFPSASPSASPTTSVQAYIESLSPDSITALDDESSPQSQALFWLEQDNPDIFDLPDYRILQRFALATFFYSTGGNQWIRNDKWLSAANECDWSTQQLVCDDNDENVVLEIELKFNLLKGTLPLEISLLSDLVDLDLSDNLLSGSLPPQISSMKDLTTLILEGNSISGAIPTEIGMLPKLFSLIISSNLFEGHIPTEVGLLGNIREFMVDGNDISGTIPVEIENLSVLDTCTLSENRLEGEIPSGLFLVEGLRELALDKNALSGPIPIASNGTIPSSKSLEILKLGSNFLTGTIPQVGMFSSLETLQMESNQLTGVLPTSLGMLSDVETLSLSFNIGIVGEIPSELGRLGKLEKLELRGLSLSGSIPSEVGSMRNLQDLDLSNNTLTDKLPTQIGMLERLDMFDVSENNLSGALISEIGMLENLKIFKADLNQFSGALPSEIGRLSNVNQVVLLGNEDMNGTLPSELGLATSLEFLFLQGSFTGFLPTELGMLSNMVDLVLTQPPFGDSLSGTIPTELALIRNLRSLNLLFTELSGTLPLEFGALTDLQVLFLIGADLTGPVGDLCQLREDKLVQLNIGCNTLCSCCADVCGSTPVSPTECESDESFVQVTVVADQKPQESSWKLVDSGSGETLLEGGPYNDVFAESSESGCIASETCAVLLVNDTGSDGICCNFGYGSYTVFVNGEEAVTISEFEGTSQSDGILACAPTRAPTKPPTPAECDETSSLLRIEITTDDFAGDTSWELSIDGEMVAQGATNPDAPATLNEFEVCVPKETCATFTIFDKYGDGICCLSGEGAYLLFLDGVEVASGGEFGSSDSVTFGSCQPTS